MCDESVDTPASPDMMDLRLNLNPPERETCLQPAGSFPPDAAAMLATDSDRILCHCLRITERQVSDAVERNALCTLREVMRSTGAGRGCMSCHSRIKAVLAGERLVSTFVVPECPGCSNPACGCRPGGICQERCASLECVAAECVLQTPACAQECASSECAAECVSLTECVVEFA